MDSTYGADGRVLTSTVVNPYDGSNSFTYEVDYDSAGRPVRLSGKLASASATTKYYEAVKGSSAHGAYDAMGRVLTMHADNGSVVSARRYNAYSGALDGECKRFDSNVECWSTSVDPSKDIYRSDQQPFTYQGAKLVSYTDSLTATRYVNAYAPSGRLERSEATPVGATTTHTQDWVEGFDFNGIGNLHGVGSERDTRVGTRPGRYEEEEYVPASIGGWLDRVDTIARRTTDEAGQPVAEPGGTTSYAYDLVGHLTQVTRSGGESESLYYAPGGELFYRKVGGKFVFYVGEYATVTASELGTSGVPDEATAKVDAHVVFAGTRIASVKAERTLYYYRSRLGSVIATSLAGGQAGASYRYGPYGELESANETELTRSDLGYTNALRLSGQLIYLQTRVYDAEARVFIQPDSVDRLRYAYVAGDPVNRSDPTGLLMMEDRAQVVLDGYALPGGANLADGPGVLYAQSPRAQYERHNFQQGDRESARQAENGVGLQGSSLGDLFRRTVPLLGGLLGGLADIASGAGNAALGVLTLGQSGTLGRGAGQMAVGLGRTLDIVVRDFAGVGMGAVGLLYTTARDAANLVTLGQVAALGNRHGDRLVPTGLLRGLGRAFMSAIIPDYAMFGGSSWGLDVWGRRADLRLNQGDVASMAHDGSQNEFEWIARNFTTRPDLQWVGPAGAAYALVGAPFFALSGLMSGDKLP